MNTKVAIVMPYYNDKALLVKSVMGILGQSYQDWELFLVDDGSVFSCKAWDVLPRSITKRVRVIEKENGGVSSARNFALELIRKENNCGYVAYCDSDDIWNEDYLEKQVNALNDDKEKVDVVYSAVQFQMIDGNPAYPYGIPFYEEFPGTDTLLNGNFIYISSLVHKVKCLSVGNFDTQLNSIEDWDMWVRIAKAGYTFKRNKDTNIIYICKPNGMGSKSNAEVYTRFYHKHSLTR